MKSNSIKKIWFCLLSGILLFVLIYMIYGHYIGKMTKEIMVSAFESYEKVENNPYSDIISDEDYNLLIIKSMADYNRENSYDKIHMTNPFVLHWFIGANVWISYDYAFYVGKENMINLTDVLVKFSYEFRDGDLYVTDCCLGSSSTGA